MKIEPKELEKEQSEIFLRSVNVNQSDQTVVYPFVQAPILKDQSSLYCASFEIAWNKIRDDIINQPIKLEQTVAWVEYLNDAPKNTSIGEKYITALAGFGKDNISSRITNELKRKFDMAIDLNYTLNSTDILSFAYLKKNIEFYSPLAEDFGREKLIFNGSDTVDFFGLKHGWANPTYKSNLRIHDYLNENDFIFQIGTKSGLDEVYFAKIQPESTLIKTYEKVISRVGKNNLELLGGQEQVRIPYVKLNLTKEFEKVRNAKLANTDFQTYFIGHAVQIIDFDLNETGILLESMADIYMLEAMSETEPRKLIFDRPFLIILKEKKADLPYFLMWVDNAEFMRKTK